jgi:glycerol-3-phosphate dehydrogenase
MNRNFEQLGAGRWDVLVIGGGIYGAWTAYDAALRGLRVAVVDKGDWAGGTSSASSKLIHGGLRYLEQLHFGMVRKSLDERRRLHAMAPHQIKPLRFLIPLYRGGRVGRLRMRAGLWLYDRLAGRGQPVASHGALSVAEVGNQYPFVSTHELTGGLTYGDCQIDDALFVVEIIDGALAAGATAVNYAEVTAVSDSGSGTRVAIRDRMTGASVNASASVVVNAAGPWAPAISGADGRTQLRLSKGVHLVMPRLAGKDAMLIMSRHDRRVIFLIPWYGRTLLGTTDSDYTGDLEKIRVTDEDAAYLLEEANAVLNGAPWDSSMILGRFAGVRALQFEAGKSPDAVSREWVVDEVRDGILVSTGGKYTSARVDAAALVDRIGRMQRAHLPASRTGGQPSPWNPGGNLEWWRVEHLARGVRAGLDEETAAHCLRFGRHLDRLLQIIEKIPQLGGRLHADLPFARAEVVWAARHSMADCRSFC